MAEAPSSSSAASTGAARIEENNGNAPANQVNPMNPPQNHPVQQPSVQPPAQQHVAQPPHVPYFGGPYGHFNYPAAGQNTMYNSAGAMSPVFHTPAGHGPPSTLPAAQGTPPASHLNPPASPYPWAPPSYSPQPGCSWMSGSSPVGQNSNNTAATSSSTARDQATPWQTRQGDATATGPLSQRTFRKAKFEDDKDDCAICFSSKPDIRILEPCGHYPVCTSCLKGTRRNASSLRCSQCRRIVHDSQLIQKVKPTV